MLSASYSRAYSCDIIPERTTLPTLVLEFIIDSGGCYWCDGFTLPSFFLADWCWATPPLTTMSGDLCVSSFPAADVSMLLESTAFVLCFC